MFRGFSRFRLEKNMKNILAAIDFSEATPKILEQAESLARGLEAHLWLVHAEDTSVEDRSDQQKIQDLVDNIRAVGIKTTGLLLEGNPAEAICSKAQELEIDFILIGSHGRTGLTKLLLGSVSDSVLRQAPCPVMVVKGYNH